MEAHYNPTQRRIIDRNGNVRLAIRTYKAEWNGDYTIHNSVLVLPVGVVTFTTMRKKWQWIMQLMQLMNLL